MLSFACQPLKLGGTHPFCRRHALNISVCSAFCALWLHGTANSCQLAAGSVNSNSELGTSFSEKLQRGVASAWVDLKTLARHPVYVLNVAATAVYTGTATFIMAIQLHLQPQNAPCSAMLSSSGRRCSSSTYKAALLKHRSASSSSDMSSPPNPT